MVITFYTFNEEATRLVHRPIKPQTDKEMTRNNQAMNESRSADVLVRLKPQG